jgi:hypothetical protein
MHHSVIPLMSWRSQAKNTDRISSTFAEAINASIPRPGALQLINQKGAASPSWFPTTGAFCLDPRVA